MLDERHDCCVNCLAVRLQLLAAKCTANRYLGLGLLVSYMPLAPRLQYCWVSRERRRADD